MDKSDTEEIKDASDGGCNFQQDGGGGGVTYEQKLEGGMEPTRQKKQQVQS